MSFLSPPLENGRHITPVALVLLDGYAEGVYNPFGRVRIFCLLQGICNQWGERANIFFVELEDVRQFLYWLAGRLSSLSRVPSPALYGS